MLGEDQVKQLVTSTQCDICGQYYEEDNINILDHYGNTWILKLYCSACHSQILMAASIDEDDSATNSKQERLIDLLETEIERFKDIIITADDILDMCEFLNVYSGSLSQLLEKD